jgi:hypothetical protein
MGLRQRRYSLGGIPGGGRGRRRRVCPFRASSHLWTPTSFCPYSPRAARDHSAGHPARPARAMPRGTTKSTPHAPASSQPRNSSPVTRIQYPVHLTDNQRRQSKLLCTYVSLKTLCRPLGGVAMDCRARTACFLPLRHERSSANPSIPGRSHLAAPFLFLLSPSLLPGRRGGIMNPVGGFRGRKRRGGAGRACRSCCGT